VRFLNYAYSSFVLLFNSCSIRHIIMRYIAKLVCLLIAVFACCSSAHAQLSQEDQLIATGDVNGDGRPDVVVINSSTNVGVYLNQGSGALGAGAFFAVLPLVVPGSITLLDANGDGV